MLLNFYTIRQKDAKGHLFFVRKRKTFQMRMFLSKHTGRLLGDSLTPDRSPQVFQEVTFCLVFDV